MNKRAFTLIEMLLVLSIIGIIFLLIRPIFDTKNNADPMDCLQSLYQQTNNFVFAWLNPQSIPFNGKIVFPDTYIVDISSDTIEYSQQYLGEKAAYDNRLLNTNTDICNIKNAYLVLSGTTKQFQIQNNTMNITIPANNAFTGSIELRKCEEIDRCDYIGQLLIDTRTQRLYIPSVKPISIPSS